MNEGGCSKMADDDVEIVQVVNDQSLGSMPHSRCDCPVHKFSKVRLDASHAEHCGNCYCYVCDVPVNECKEWKKATLQNSDYNYTKQADNAHCHAYSKPGMITPGPYVYGQKDSYAYTEMRKKKREERERERKEKEKKEKAEAARKKMDALMKKIKVKFTCGCFLCNGLRQFIANEDAKELLVDLADATSAERTCFIGSVEKERQKLGAIKSAGASLVVWKRGQKAGAAVKLAVKKKKPKPAVHSYYGYLGGYGGYGMGYDSDDYDGGGYGGGYDSLGEYDSDGFDADGYNDDGEHRSELGLQPQAKAEAVEDGVIVGFTSSNGAALPLHQAPGDVRKATLDDVG